MSGFVAPAPTETDWFNILFFYDQTTATGGLTTQNVHYPVAQGLVSFPDGVNLANDLTFTSTTVTDNDIVGANSIGCLGLTLTETTSGNTIQLTSDGTISNQLDVSGNVSINATQTYPQTTNTSQLASISYVNDSVTGSSLLGTNNTWTGTNAFNTTTPTTSITQTYPQTTSTTDFATILYVNDSVGLSNPVGTILMWGGNTTAPTGYLFCNGDSYSTTTYAALYAVIGSTYFIAPYVSGYFNVPQFHTGTSGTAVFPVAGGLITNSGVAQSTGVTGSVPSATTYGGSASLSITQIPDHTHIASQSGQYINSLTSNNDTTISGTTSVVGSGSPSTFAAATGLMSGVYSSNQVQGQYYPPYCATTYIIKY